MNAVTQIRVIRGGGSGNTEVEDAIEESDEAGEDDTYTGG